MNNKNFKIGDHILVQGRKGIVRDIDYCTECKYTLVRSKYDIVSKIDVLCNESIDEMKKQGYELVPTGRTATYFKVSFENDEDLKGTSYNNAWYGCLDEFENYFEW